MKSREFIETIFLKKIQREFDKLDQVVTFLERVKEVIEQLVKQDELTIPFLKATLEDCKLEIGYREIEYRGLRCLYECYEKDLTSKERTEYQNYFDKKKDFSRKALRFQEFADSLKSYLPGNASQLQEKVRLLLLKEGFVIDGHFEGDYATWIGVYARPRDKPTYLDPNSDEEFALQDKYSIGGFKQDFSEWFEWDIKENEIVV